MTDYERDNGVSIPTKTDYELDNGVAISNESEDYTAPTGYASKVVDKAENVISPLLNKASLAFDVLTGTDSDKKLKEASAVKYKNLSTEEKAKVSEQVLIEKIEKLDEQEKAEEFDKQYPPVGEGEAAVIGAKLIGLQVVKPFMEVASYMSEDSATTNNIMNKYLQTIDKRLNNPRTGKVSYGIAKGEEFLPQVVAGWMTKGGTSALLTAEFFAGIAYESTSVYPDETKPGDFRNANIKDMALSGAFNMIAAGSGELMYAGYQSYKKHGGLAPIFAPKHIQDMLLSSPDNLMRMIDVTKLKDDMGITLENYLVTGGTNLFSDVATSSKGINLWENRVAARKFYAIDKKLLDFGEKALNAIYKVGEPIDMMNWRQLSKVQQDIYSEVGRLNDKYKGIVNEAYKGADEALATVKHIPINVNKLVTDIQEVFAENATSVTTAVKPLLDKIVSKGGLAPSKVKALEDNYELAFKELSSARSNVQYATTPFAKKRADKILKLAISKEANLGSKIKRLSKQNFEVNLGQLENLRKLINHKIYVPGQNVSMSDRMALQGLQSIKGSIDEVFSVATTANKELFEASLPLLKARDVARKKGEVLGLSADNTFLTDLVLKGDTKSISMVLKDPEEGFKAVKFLGDKFGMDSDVYRASAREYIQFKLTGSTVESLTSSTRSTAHAYSVDKAKPARFAAAVNNITDADIKLIRATMGEDVASKWNGLKSFSGSYADHIKYLEGKDVPISTKDIIMTKPITAIFDAMSYYSRKLLEMSIAGAPITRSITGAASGMAINATTSDDIDLESLVSSMAVGAITGHYGGRALRFALEPDIRKIVRFIKDGKHLKARKATTELNKRIKQSGGHLVNRDLTLKEAIKLEKNFDLDSAMDMTAGKVIKAGTGSAVGGTMANEVSDDASANQVAAGAGVGAALPYIMKGM